MTLGQNIARLRAQKNLSQGDLADALEVSRQSVSKWETDAAFRSWISSCGSRSCSA